jgi:peptidoglycan-N-acetylglucosamine deacetylase
MGSTQKAAIVTTSWDDGHPLDIRLAEMLASYGVPGTFYVPLRYESVPVMDTKQIRALRAMGMEIGSHTLTHPNLTKVRKHHAIHELVESKKQLEDIVGEPIVSFCYPAGKFNAATRSCVIEANYKLARTTVAFRTERNSDPFCMPVSFQLYPHRRSVHLRHALKEGNLTGLLSWCGLWEMENDPVQLAESLLQHCRQHGGVWHLWGHSWEIEEFHLWGVLEDVLRRISNLQDVLYRTNSQVLDTVALPDRLHLRPGESERIGHG